MAERSSRWDVKYFASCAADALMEMLCNTYLQDNLSIAEEACNGLKHKIHDLLPRCLADAQSEQIFEHVSQIEDKIKHFDHLPWYKNVLELFGESVIHPHTSTIWYKPNSGKLSVQYFTGHLVKKRTLKAFIFKESKAKTVCSYQWQPRNKTFRSIMKMLEREKKLKSERRWRANQCERPETRELLLQICKEDEDRAAAAKTPELKLEDFINRLDALQVFTFPFLCNYDYLSITSLATLRIVDVSFSRFITNASVPLLGSIRNLQALNILRTRIDKSGTITLLRKLLETRKEHLRHFLGPTRLTGEALRLLLKFDVMQDYEFTLEYFHCMSLHIK